MTVLDTPEAVDAAKEQIEAFAEDWLTGEPVDWDAFTARFEQYTGLELPGSYSHPAMKRFQSIVRTVNRELRD